MTRVDNTLRKLQELDLKTYPLDIAKELIKEFLNLGIMEYKLPRGSFVLRARLNEGGKPFRNVSDLSFKPQEYNKTFQRASTPNKTVFYASTLPSQIGSINHRIISTLEISQLIKEAKQDQSSKIPQIQEELITFGKWEVTKDLPLVAICYFEKFIDRHPLTQQLHSKYKDILGLLPEELQDGTLKINDFFANEFGKDQITNDYDYLLSAAFSEVVIESGHAGVLYPSVRCEGEGYNIAIAPEFVTKHLRPVAAGEVKLYRKGKEFFMNNTSNVLIAPGQKKFTLLSLKGSKLYTDEKMIYAHLNGNLKINIKKS